MPKSCNLEDMYFMPYTVYKLHWVIQASLWMLFTVNIAAYQYNSLDITWPNPKPLWALGANQSPGACLC